MVRKVPQNHRYDGLSTRNLILDTAEKLFSIDGYAAVSIRKITSKAGTVTLTQWIIGICDYMEDRGMDFF